MQTLNRSAARAMVLAGVACATDVTGFGLIGHLQEMAQGSGVAMRLSASKIPLLPGVLKLVRQGVLNPGITMNESSFSTFVKKPAALNAEQQALVNVSCMSQRTREVC